MVKQRIEKVMEEVISKAGEMKKNAIYTKKHIWQTSIHHRVGWGRMSIYIEDKIKYVTNIWKLQG